MSASTLTGSSLLVHAQRRARRPTWVSTVIPGTPKAFPRTTFAVFLPTPGSLTSSSRVRGTSPPWFAHREAARPMQEAALAL